MSDVDDVETDEDEIDGNRAEGATAEAVLQHVLEHLVDEPDEIEIDVDQRGNEISLVARVAKPDMGRVIGRRGRVAQAIREIVRAAAAKDGLDADVDFAD
ncbi:MAG: KH domain-containing protein [Actinomycetota bacterium]